VHPDVEDWIARQPGRDDTEAYLFPTLANRKGGGRNGYRRFRAHHGSELVSRAKYYVSVIAKAVVRSLSFHSFRHGAASIV